MARIRNAPGYRYTAAGRARLSGFRTGRRRFIGAGTGGRVGVRLPRRLRGYVRRNGAYTSILERRAELKALDTAVSNTLATDGQAVPTTMTSLALCAVNQGSSSSNRVGRMIFVKSVQFRGYLNFDPGDLTIGSSVATVRFILDTQTNGGQAGASDVFTGTYGYAALRNRYNLQRFKVLKTWNVQLQSPAGVQTDYSVVKKPISFFMKFPGRGLAIEYTDTATTTAADIKTNSIFGVADSTNATVSIAGTWRLSFTDA